MNQLYKQLLCLVVLLTGFANLNAQNFYYVRTGGTGDGSSWANASADFQAMVNAAAAGDEVWVAAGNYSPALNQSFTLKEGVKIYGGFPDTGDPGMNDRDWLANASVLTGNNNTVITSTGHTNATVLNGFRITGGGSTSDINGGGISIISSAPLIENVEIHQNSAHSGAGIFCSYSDAVIRNVNVHNNNASHGGGGIFMDHGDTTILNALVADNTSYYGSGIEILEGAATITNITVTGNQAQFQGAGFYFYLSTVSITNSIVWENTVNSAVNNINASGTINYSYSLIQDSGSSSWNSAFGIDGGNNIGGDPLFVDAGTGNYALQLTSPAIDSGNTTAFTDAENALDLTGNPRAAGSAIDMGAYERVLPLTRYVKQGGTGDGTSWANASGDFQAMINASIPDDGVWVAAGTYQPAVGQYFSMKEGVKIYGGFPATGDPGMEDIDHTANETILEGNGSHVIRNSGGITEAALLDGFTITGGEAPSGGGISNWGVSPTLRNLNVHGNTSAFGGGILNINNAAPVITNTIITGNDGTGITNFNSDAIIRNSLITNNTNGGIYNENSSATITNVTLSGNSSQPAIAITIGGSVEVGNCIIYGNANGSVSVSDADTYFYNNLIEGGLPGWDEGGAPDGNIDADPLFTDAANGDYSLQQGSPAIDAGDTNLFDNAENETDLAGNSRVYGFSIDMGAFESVEDIIAPIRYVRNGGSGNGLSWENASGDIQAMIDQSLPGDEVWVAQGGYSADSDVPFSMKEGVKIYGGFPEEGDPAMEDRNWKLYPTELYGSGGRVFYNENLSSDSVLDGFFIYSGYTSEDGAGIFNDNVNAVFSNLVIEGNYAEGNGGGMYNSFSNPTLINISFRYNEAASNGGALYNESNVSIFNVLISDNTAGYGAGMYNFGAFTVNVTNTLVTKNHAYTDGGGILNGSDATTNISNSIILNNTLDSGSGENIYIEDGFTVNSAYSLIQGSGGSTGWDGAFGNDGGNNIDADPMFVDAAGNNYRLQPDSPAVDAGNTAAFADAENAVDFAGNPRLSGSAIDIGMYERSNAPGTIRYVMQDGTGNGTSWADASGDLQEMMDISSYDDEVWVAAGDYTAPQDDYFYMREGVKVYGGFPATGDPGFSDRDWIANTTTLSGNGAGVVYNETLSSATVLNGFTITGGTSDYQGGGIYNSEANVRLENLIITNNTAGGVGGGISNSYSNIVLTNVRITNNTAQFEGGGIYSEGGNPVLVNVLIDNNNAETGAGIYCGYTTITFTNVTIADNQAASNIGGLYNNYEAFTTVANAVIWGNTASGSESNIYIGEDSSADFSYSLIQGSGGSSAWDTAFGNDGGNNIDMDPLFTNTVNGDYTLQSESPAKNAGNDAAFDTALTTTDLAGNPRISDSAIDMGPYEGSLGPCGTLTTWNGSSWSQGQPVSNAYSAYIDGDFDSAENGEITACSLTVASGTVTVADGDDFVIKGAVTVTGGSLTFGHNSNLIQEDDVANSGNITYQRNSSPLYRLDYTFWSSPVAGQQLQAFSPGTLSNRFYIYDTDPDAYTAIDPTGNFETGKGYLIRMPNTWPDFVDEETPGTSWTGSFNGVPNNGIIPVEVSTGGERYNAIGNPYPSPISIQDFLSANESVLDSGAALYFWRKRNDPDVSSYASITLMGYAPNEVPGGDSDQAFFPDDAVETWVINPGQGFIVRTYDPTIERMDNPDEVMFTNAMRRGTNNGQFFRNGNPASISRFRLIISGSEPGQYCQAIIGYTNITTTSLDYGWDGRSLNDGAVTLFSVNDDTKLAIQARAAFDVNDVVPVGYTAEAPGSYTITLGTFDGVFEDGQDIYLIDKVTDVTHNLKDGSYTFTTEAGEFTERFEVVYMQETMGTDSPVINAGSVIVYKQGRELHISSGSVDMQGVTVYDTHGRMLYKRQGINAAKTVIADLQAQEQVLIIEINTPKGKVSKKVVY